MKKLTTEEFNKLIEISSNIKRDNHFLRLGQLYMNTLHELRPDVYEEITGTDYDCFYTDDKISDFFTFLRNI